MNTIDYEKVIFKKKNASLYRQFVAYADSDDLSPEERKACYYHFYAQMFCYWPEHTPRYRDFLNRVVRHDWVLFLHYVHEHTILGEVRFPLQDGKTDAKLTWLNEKRVNEKMRDKKQPEKGKKGNEAHNGEPEGSDRQLAFCVLLSFRFRVKPSVNALRGIFYKRPFFNDSINEFLWYAEELQEEKAREDREMEKRKYERYKQRRK